MSVLERAVNTPAAWSERAAAAPTSWEAAGWTRLGQRERLRAVRFLLDLQVGETLLDFGCGTGALCEMLRPGVGYIGFDTAEGMIARARGEHPGRPQTRRFTLAEPDRFDAAACVGTFNLPGSKASTWQTLRRLWDNTGRVLVASLYAGTDERCLIYTQAEVEEFARSESFYWRVLAWRSNDLMLILSRKAIA